MSEHIANSYNWRASQFDAIFDYINGEIHGYRLDEEDAQDWLLVLEEASYKETVKRDEVLEQIRTLDTVMSRHGVRSFEAQVLPA